MPSRDLSGPNPMRLETNLTLHTYVGNVYKNPELLHLNTEVNIVKNVSIKDFLEIKETNPEEAKNYVVNPYTAK